MSRAGDYPDEMTLSHVTDEDIERAFEGLTSHGDLDSFRPLFAALIAMSETPEEETVQRISSRLALVVRDQQTQAQAVQRIANRPRRAPRFSRLATAGASMLALFAMSGIGLAANHSAPGDLLYNVDIAMEKVGIGDGQIDERLDEVTALGQSGDYEGALAHLQDSLGKSGEPDAVVFAAIEVLSAELADSDEAQEKIAALLAFISVNKGPGVGLDGKDFGQGVAEIARGWEQADQDSSESDAGTEDASGESENSDTGSKDNDGTAPGNSENSNAGGNNNDATPPGSSENSNAGGNNNDGTPPGNSENSNAGGNGNGNGNGGSGGNGNPGGNGNGSPGNGKP